jgi:hypothetical protein
MAFTPEQQRILDEINAQLGDSLVEEEEEQKPESFVKKANRYAQAINTGVFSILPPQAQRKLQEFGITLPRQPEGGLEAGLAGIGQAAPLAIGGVASLTAKTAAPWLSSVAQAGGIKGGVAKIGQDIAKFATQSPRAFWTAETAGAFGSGALPEMVGADTTSEQMLASLAGGVAGGLAPAAAPGVARRALETFAPFTKAGGELRAARQMQERAIDPELAARRALEAPEGVTPARATGEERLMAQEARLLEDAPPSVSQKVQEDLIKAQENLEQGMRSLYGRPRSEKEWERAVMERVAAPGAKIEPGTTSRMLDDAYKSFDPLYEKAKNISIPTEGLADTIKKSISDPDLLAGNAQRSLIRNWFGSQYNNFIKTRAADGVIDSGDLIELRSIVRGKMRDYGRATTEDSKQYRDILQNIEADLSKTLETQLTGEPLAALRTADSQYRQYKIVEDAVFRSGDGAFTPDRMAESIRMASSSKSAYARGIDKTEQELRLLAQAGRKVADVLGDPAAARALVRDFNSTQLRPIKASFIETALNATKSIDRTPGLEGRQFVSGTDLKVFLNQNRATAKALKFSDDELKRLDRFANELIVMERKSPAAVAQLFGDGPATYVQLGATLLGARGGQKIAGGGLGSSLVLASFLAKRARDNVARLTSDKATELMTQAITDKKLYAALLTKPTDSAKKVNAAVKTLNAWFINNFPEEGPSFDEEQRQILDTINEQLRAGQVAP